ncbi:MAG TPA: 4Fe-4S ferredoxin [Chloroflexi bacterium]|nr:4Fe-4S ferredoxin [Chloroflexota bacterium]
MNSGSVETEEGFAEKTIELQGRASRVTLPGATNRYVMFHDQERCIGCFACEVACKLENDVPVGPRLVRMIQVGPQEVNGRLRTRWVYMSCYQCEHAACVAVCPTGAMRTRESDGIVYVDEASCIGCKACILACPWGAVQFNPRTNKVIKCDYCKDRVDQGLWPACATKCATKALFFGNANEYTTVLRERAARRQANLE